MKRLVWAPVESRSFYDYSGLEVLEETIGAIDLLPISKELSTRVYKILVTSEKLQIIKKFIAMDLISVRHGEKMS